MASSPVRAVPSIGQSAAVSPPTRLRLADLLHATDHYADGVLEGRFDHLLPAGGLPADARWYTRLHTDDELDAFPLGWVHDVAAAQSASPETLSVHAYSPPLTAMAYYEVTPRKIRRRVRTELTDHPAAS